MAAYQIPSDVVVEILVRLPMKRLLNFKSVCKNWYTLINSSLFIQFHLRKSLEFNFRHNHTFFYTNNDSLCVFEDIYRPLKPIKINWPEIIRNREYSHFVGSCNGLVCFCVIGIAWTISCFLICNPSTHTFKFKQNLPFSEFKCLQIGGLSCGFGYDGEHDDYKIVVTRKLSDDVYIYSCKADSWKCATHTPAKGSSGSYYLQVDKVVFANNMLHYVVSTGSVQQSTNYYPNYRIACFDLSSETWRDDLSFPVGVETSTCLEFGVLNRCLYLRLDESDCSHNIWIKKGYRDEDLWSKTYNIPVKFENFTLVAPSKDGPPRLLFERKYFDERAPNLFWYDPYADTTEAFELERSSRDSLLHLCIASLVRIPGSSINFRGDFDDKDALQ